jgi:hypothetical protein
MVRPLLLPLIPNRARSSLSFSSPAPSSTPPALEPPESHTHPSVSVLSAPPVPSVETVSTKPPPKRRRAKRTEEERIQYLRSDPYVAKFEAFRVLCASCDKWIRLRPNSTYCSIPWDAHRKSCLARKGCVIYNSSLSSSILNAPRGPSLPTYTAPKIQRHPSFLQTLTPANMTVNVSSVRPATAGFLSAKRPKLRKLGHSIVPGVVLHPHLPLQLHLQFRG